MPHVRERWTTSHAAPGVAVTRDYTIASCAIIASRGTDERRGLARQTKRILIRRVYALCDTVGSDSESARFVYASRWVWRDTFGMLLAVIG